MTIGGSLALYFIIWWTVLFAILPIGVRSQAEAGDVAAGTDILQEARLGFEPPRGEAQHFRPHRDLRREKRVAHRPREFGERECSLEEGAVPLRQRRAGGW